MRASRIVTSQDQWGLEGPSKGRVSRTMVHLYYPQHCLGLPHAGLEVSQKATGTTSEAMWDAVSICGMTDTSNWHMYRKAKQPPEKRLGIPRVTEGLCKCSTFTLRSFAL